MWVIRSGETTVSRAAQCAQATRNKPHHTVASPK
jgi:hypothetical protein